MNELHPRSYKRSEILRCELWTHPTRPDRMAAIVKGHGDKLLTIVDCRDHIKKKESLQSYGGHKTRIWGDVSIDSQFLRVYYIEPAACMKELEPRPSQYLG